MTEESQITSVDDIAHDDQKLEEKAKQLTGKDVILDPKDTVGTDFEMVDLSVCAVLVKKNSAWGAVRVTGIGTPKQVPNRPESRNGV